MTDNFTFHAVQDVQSFTQLCQSVTELCWYISPSSEKFKYQGASMPKFFGPLEKFNNPKRYNHKIKSVRRETLLELTANVNYILQISFAQRNSFNYVCDLFDKIGEAAVKKIKNL